jgi:hypothetical protein
MEKNKKITWEALSHIKTEKSSDWYWILGIITIGASILSIYFNNLLLALLILIGTFAIFVQTNIEPKTQKFELNRKGVVVGSTLYPYSTLESFYVIDEDGWDRDRILIKSKKNFMPLITIPLGESVKPEQASEFLIEYLDEEHLQESAIERIMLILGF